jgi:branched-chain amino acid transport system substrate-binding protein
MKTRSVRGILLAAAFAAGCAGASAQTAGISDGTVKIGVLTDMAGLFSDLAGAGAVTAAQMAIDDFVEKQKPPFKVELVSADHQNKPDIATGIARQWYDTGNVDLITDVINSGVALAVSSVAEAKNRMLIVTGSGSTRLTNEQCSPNTISYTWDTYAFQRPVVDREIARPRHLVFCRRRLCARQVAGGTTTPSRKPFQATRLSSRCPSPGVIWCHDES